jgi:hypothetical protein
VHMYCLRLWPHRHVVGNTGRVGALHGIGILEQGWGFGGANRDGRLPKEQCSAPCAMVRLLTLHLPPSAECIAAPVPEPQGCHKSPLVCADAPHSPVAGWSITSYVHCKSALLGFYCKVQTALTGRAYPKSQCQELHGSWPQNACLTSTCCSRLVSNGVSTFEN